MSVFGGGLGVGVEGLVDGEPDVAAESGVAGLGDPRSGLAVARLVHFGDHPGEGTWGSPNPTDCGPR